MKPRNKVVLALIRAPFKAGAHGKPPKVLRQAAKNALRQEVAKLKGKTGERSFLPQVIALTRLAA